MVSTGQWWVLQSEIIPKMWTVAVSTDQWWVLQCEVIPKILPWTVVVSTGQGWCYSWGVIVVSSGHYWPMVGVTERGNT